MTHKLKGRLVFLAIAVLCMVAPVTAAIMFYTGNGPTKTTNVGTLVTPAVQLEMPPLPRLEGGTMAPDWFQHRWTLVYAGSPNCPEKCKKALYYSRQIRLALGPRMNKLQRLFLVTGRADHAQALRRAHPHLTVVDINNAIGQEFFSHFPKPNAFGRTYWLVDPQGRIMMTYRTQTDANGIVADIKHLLRY